MDGVAEPGAAERVLHCGVLRHRRAHAALQEAGGTIEERQPLEALGDRLAAGRAHRTQAAVEEMCRRAKLRADLHTPRITAEDCR